MPVTTPSRRKRRPLAVVGLAIVAVVSVLGGASAASGQPLTARPAPAAMSKKGPVGWDAYRDIDAMARLRPQAQEKQFSSFDRTGGNDDGFNGTYSCLRTVAEGCVIAEQAGSGEISSIWFTRDYGDVTKTGTITITLDGTTVLSAQLQDVVSGRLGAPFVWPLVGTGADTSGGAVIKVPMPYRQSMRITVANNPLFYHVTYRKYADADGVNTFDPKDKALDVVTKLRSFGVADPKPAAPGATVTAMTASLPSGIEGGSSNGTAATFAKLTGPGRISQVRIKMPQLEHNPRVGDDGRAFGAGGGSTFTVAVDPGNSGVRLTRRFDPSVGNQKARVLVDGTEVGQWTSGAARDAGSWADQDIEVPASLTAGKSSLRISTQFVSSDIDVNEFRYDVHSKVGSDWTRTDVLDLGPNHPGEEQAHGYTVTAQNWSGVRAYRYSVPSEQLFTSEVLLVGTRLRITFDGKTTVDSPIGEFFGSGIGDFDTRALMTSVDSTDGGWLTAWWPMPYRKSATVELVNQSGMTISSATVEVTSAPDAAAEAGLGAEGTMGYFSATSGRGEVTDGKDWNFLDTTGQGVFYGVSHSMRGEIEKGNLREYLEGDERAYVDGVASPAFSGTGTEDFYESGWYFRDGTTYVMPTAGNPGYQPGGDGCQHDCTSAYRLLVADAVPFSTGLTFGIEHGPDDHAPAVYTSTAFWYGRPGAALRDSDRLETGDPASRTAHAFTAQGETQSSLTSTFEGRDSGKPVTRSTVSATGACTFTIKVDAANAGVRLVRLSDQQTAYQSATVLVDGKPVGIWLQPLANQTSRWLEDTFELPASVTAGKSSLSIRIEPTAGAPAWSASRYLAQSHVVA
ncbi:MAG: DUF2961 domain-containing protein [Kutzneria sp.]|nr:DUF2961 domain-containing protein [Kutzneria sp.]MBV9846512.1 DUF2961 domain-containing protein [Kutzneria sp.]